MTHGQLQRLGNAMVFAVTRSLEETRAVRRRADENLVWGCGVHPAVPAARAGFDVDAFRDLLGSFSLVGEVGLDRRAGRLEDQAYVLRAVLSTIEGAPVLVSMHSAGCAADVSALVREVRHPGMILHWFLGDASAVRRAADAGCYFSVNGAMPDDALRRIPPDRLLPETDFPSTARRGGGRRPGDTSNLERRMAVILGESTEQLRWRWYRNLRAVSLASGALETLPDNLADLLVSV